ncbi:PH domain-containing protein [Microbacterium sp. BWT-B31]|uniref:PH domain-containing protein n=1 Tax=Microbacterium sp. BWT-B31 TaxID=3232072 RepID=UPI003528859E
MPFQEVFYRPVFSRILAAVTIGVCAIGVIAMVWQDAESAVRYAWLLALIAVVAWAMFWRPSLRVQEHGITVVNVFRTHFVAWPAIEAIETKYSLTLRTAHGVVRAWASPAPGRQRTYGLARKDFDGVGQSARGEHESLRPSDALSTPGGNLAQVIRGHWERMSAAGLFASGVDPEASVTTWHWTTIAVIAGLAAATIVGLLV